MNLILRAAALAVRAHEGQTRKYTGFPYVTHPARVAGRTAILPGATEEMIAAAYLHDVLEDTKVSREEIEKETSPLVGNLVDQMTNRSKASGLSRAERKAMDRERLSTVSMEAKKIKILDRIDNLLEMTDAPVDFKKRYTDESLFLAAVLAPADPALADELHAVIQSVRAAVERDEKKK